MLPHSYCPQLENPWPPILDPAPQDPPPEADHDLLGLRLATGRVLASGAEIEGVGVVADVQPTCSADHLLACISKRKPTWLFSSGPDGHTRKLKLPDSEIEKGMKTDGDFWYYRLTRAPSLRATNEALSEIS